MTTEQVHLSFPDGTSLTLAPGVPVGPAQVSDGGVPLRDFWAPELSELFDEKVQLPPLEIPNAKIGEETVLRPVDTGSDPNLKLATIDYDAHWFDFAGQKRPLGFSVMFSPEIVRREDGRSLIDFSGRCLSARAWVASRWVHQLDGVAAGGVMEGTMGCVVPGPSWITHKGAKISWPDGSALGHTRESLRLFHNPVRSPGRICFALGYGESADSFACFAERDLREDLKGFTPCESE